MSGGRGGTAFERYYESLFGDRWPSLRRALTSDTRPIELSSGLLKPYYIDRGSVIAAEALAVDPGQNVVDLCAAPGGKTLVLALALSGSGLLFANERSSARRARLHNVLEGHLPQPLREPIRVTSHDATRWGIHNPQSADRILADVPCSSERHVINSPAALDRWSESRTRRLAQQAYAIGCAGVDSLVPGGEMVYSTCALSPLENDLVIERLLKRGDGVVERVSPQSRLTTLPSASHYASPPGSATDQGWIILPDRDDGMGPIFLAILRRTR